MTYGCYESTAHWWIIPPSSSSCMSPTVTLQICIAWHTCHVVRSTEIAGAISKPANHGIFIAIKKWHCKVTLSMNRTIPGHCSWVPVSQIWDWPCFQVPTKDAVPRSNDSSSHIMFNNDVWTHIWIEKEIISPFWLIWFFRTVCHIFATKGTIHVQFSTQLHKSF